MARLRARLASRNRHKLEELRAVLPGWEVELLDPEHELPPETGDTYYANARAKARAGIEASPDEWVLGEDSGIEAEALDGRPGLHSARWADDGVARLLEELRGVGERGARYVCELVAVSSEGRELRGTGVLEGTVAEAPSGSEGFGYDPIFVPEGEAQTVAALGNEWKRRHSHRARAARALLEALARHSP